MLIFLAHPLSGDIPGNLARAKRWLRWARLSLKGHHVIAPWITECEIFDDNIPEERDAGIEFNRTLIKEHCDGLLLVGGRISGGMALERQAAEAVKKEFSEDQEQVQVMDLTHLGEEPPEKLYEFPQ